MPVSNARALGALFAGVLFIAACSGEGGANDNPSTSESLTTEEGAVAPAPYTRCPEGRWCSALYPPNPTADAAADGSGRFLHDFSYAGFRHGEKPPTFVAGATHDVVASYGADATGGKDATSSIQSAIDAASSAGGGVVYFPAGSYRVDHLLTVTASGVVLRGAGKESVLHFTKASGMADKAHLTFEGSVKRDAPRTLAADAPVRATEVFLNDARGLASGDDIALGWSITPSFIEEHGMTGTWTAFNGKYEPFFRSKVVAVDTTVTPHRVVLDVPLRYAAKMRDGAAVQKESGYLRQVGIEHLGLTNATTWEQAWADDRVNVLTLRDVADAWVNDVHSTTPPGITDPEAHHLRSGGIIIENAKSVSVVATTMQNPQNRGTGGNGYLFEVSRTNEVLFSDCVARRGRHNFIQNWGFGNAGTVFLRCTSAGSEMLSVIGGVLTPEPARSEHHHSLAMATLVDECRLDDGFGFENRGAYSDGAGHTATESVVWRSSGKGTVKSQQYGWGYVIGTYPELKVDTHVDGVGGKGTAPEDFLEGRGDGETLFPASLYEDQRARRLTRH